MDCSFRTISEALGTFRSRRMLAFPQSWGHLHVSTHSRTPTSWGIWKTWSSKKNSVTLPFSSTAYRPDFYPGNGFLKGSLTPSPVRKMPARLISWTWIGWKIRIKMWTLTDDFSEMIEDKSSHWWQQKVEFSTGFAISK